MSSDDLSNESDYLQWSDTDDSDLEIVLKERKSPKTERFFEDIVPRFNDEEYKEHFRVSKNVAEDIAARFERSEYYKWQTGPHEKITPSKHTNIFLWFAGHQTASFRDVGDRFDISISTLHTVIKRMTYFLSNLSHEVILWPNNAEKIVIERYFRQNNGFPGIVGAVDGTHIKIGKPPEDPESYVNRKGYYSIQAQIVCDHKLKITDLFVGYPGSVPDTRVFRASQLFSSLHEKCNDHHILGDRAYPLLYNLMTPFPGRVILTRKEVKYNIQHSSNRICIEHCIGVLKEKWQQLCHVKLRDVRTTVHFIRACCVLHNLGLDDRFDLNMNIEPEQRNPHGGENVAELGNHDAVEKRNRIVNIL